MAEIFNPRKSEKVKKMLKGFGKIMSALIFVSYEKNSDLPTIVNRFVKYQRAPIL
jgi:pyridoxal/pyridoxine/pyridoxamine kinase